MACKSDLAEQLSDFDNLVELIRCVYTSDAGLGLDVAVFGLFLFGTLGMGLSIRTQHPAPILVAGILSSGVIAASIPGIAAKIFALVLFFGLVGLGLYVYQRTQRTL